MTRRWGDAETRGFLVKAPRSASRTLRVIIPTVSAVDVYCPGSVVDPLNFGAPNFTIQRPVLMSLK